MKHVALAVVWVAFVSWASAQQPAVADFVKPGDNLVIEGIPPVPTKVAESTERYGEARTAVPFDWHPRERSMLIGTRFAETSQVHSIKMPGGARRQMTFYPDRVLGAHYLPDGEAFVFQKDLGGGEWYQLYRQDTATGEVTLLTDGKSRNDNVKMAHGKSLLAFASTRRTGKDADIWVMDAMHPESSRMVLQVEGGGWEPLDWSPDGTKLLVKNFVSVNEAYLWMVDVASGAKTPLTPKQNGEKVAYDEAYFSRDGKAIYATTDLGSEYLRLARFDLTVMKPKFLTSDISWDIETFAVSEDGRTVAFLANEDGLSKLYLLDAGSDKYRAVPGVPVGVVGSLRFHKNSRDLAFSINSARSPSDVYSLDVKTGNLERWTESETGGLNASKFVEPKLVRWKTFDGRMISGFLYSPDAAKFPGKRPVIVSIHGGPEGQSRPVFLGRNDYFLNELGIAVLMPNVRGSLGYGKTFSLLDNGSHREDTYKDIGALLDWIQTSDTLDSSRVMAFGGSYGGHMTWAVAAFYGDRIRCALPIVGMSNLVTFLEHTEAYRRDLRRVEYGDERDAAMRAYLEKIAPMNHLDAMHKPIFAVVGKNDPRVPWTESRQIVDKLKAQNTPTWFLMANDEGHGYAKKKNNDYLFNAEVMFVEKYLLDGMTQP
ncbi:S9 family peptidase [Edaphobacter aggregans]|uniref:S9 family peptidase n=1 Tax=Edaphobacter aggregans TaxID=570835 RepID=UPI000A0089D2|nr:alpha/beta fold hydrolase [Edaphobacter aggregans]